MSALSVVYTSQKSAWIDSTIFMKWFLDVFIPSVKAHQLKNGKRQKTLVLLENAPTHPSCDILNEKDEFIKVTFLPPNVISLLQSMDQGVIETFKRYYRKELLRKLLLEREEDGEESLLRNDKNIDLKDASYMISAAWNSVKEENLKKAWNKILDSEVNSRGMIENDEQNDMSEILGLLKEIDCHECDEENIHEWMNIDDADPGHQIMQDSEIVNVVTDKDDATSI
ncbi:jerky protein homolog-like [Schistocerca cancellata]|uniref:jerky protein homolog-like n=1 Tax=Schistocerca cancellata TaxID=274614 RepID=UPI002117FB70|nr:jerky protein homolog-like [Schistocerca cancellata]